MWLIDTTKFTLRDIGHLVPYAILSHTWIQASENLLDAEVSFADMQDLPKARQKKGWKKIEKTCDLARAAGLKWAWIDTCCINKNSSAELSEAINSMYRWYQEAEVCVVYLSDLPPGRVGRISPHGHDTGWLSDCRWFTRGWTLQELIAPSKVDFYSSNWQKFGTKASMVDLISYITGIDSEVLADNSILSTIPVARRMSWASARQTSRIEDIAYSLLGLFDVNLPLIYGEGNKAFYRLQDAIAREQNDLTLFAWSSDNGYNFIQDSEQSYMGIFAKSPRSFGDCGGIERIQDPSVNDLISFTNTNRGITFLASPYRSFGLHHIYLFCRKPTQNNVVLTLTKTLNGFARYMSADVASHASVLRETRYFEKPISCFVPAQISAKEAVQIQEQARNALRFRVKEEETYRVARFGIEWEKSQGVAHSWDESSWMFLTGDNPSAGGLLWPNLSPKHTAASNWLTDLRIICGFEPQPSESSTFANHIIEHFTVSEWWKREGAADGFPLKPFAYFIGEWGDKLVPVDSTTTDPLFSTYRSMVDESKPYSSIVSFLRHRLMTNIPHFGQICPTTVRLCPHAESQKTFNMPASWNINDGTDIKLSLHCYSSEENGYPIHDIVLELVFAPCERSHYGLP